MEKKFKLYVGAAVSGVVHSLIILPILLMLPIIIPFAILDFFAITVEKFLTYFIEAYGLYDEWCLDEKSGKD